MQKTLAKVNYHIHIDAIKETLIPHEITKQQAGLVPKSAAHSTQSGGDHTDEIPAGKQGDQKIEVNSKDFGDHNL